MNQIDLRSSDSVQGWLAHWMASELNLEATEIDPDRAFLSYGMDSMHAMMLVGDLEGIIESRLSPTLAWDHPNVRALAEYLVAKVATLSTGQESVTAWKEAISRREPDARAILAQLDGMSEEELDSLLLEHMNASSRTGEVSRVAESTTSGA